MPLRTLRELVVLLAALPLLGIPPMSDSVPIARLLRNVSAYAQAHPNDSEAHYLLGRLHASAFLLGATEKLPVAAVKQVGDRVVYTDEKASSERPMLVHRGPSLRPRSAAPLQPADIAHFHAAIREYQRALALGWDERVSYQWDYFLAPNRALAYLGLAWMLEQGARYPGQLGPPPEVERSGPQSNTPEQWRERALQAYRRCYTAAGNQESGDPNGRLAPHYECGDAMVRLLKVKLSSAPDSLLDRLFLRDPHAAERRELARLEQAMRGPRVFAISPILLATEGGASLASLLDPAVTVRFDLDGSGQPRRWPWVRPGTGILVWDPGRTGRITSGTQLFGSVTWWLFWADGYQPLAALDDDGDGWLAGPELAGLAVWVDRNQNAVSEPGEVVTIKAAGIRRIAARPQGRLGNVPFHAEGMKREDGTTVPSYDWMPVALP